MGEGQVWLVAGGRGEALSRKKETSTLSLLKGSCLMLGRGWDESGTRSRGLGEGREPNAEHLLQGRRERSSGSTCEKSTTAPRYQGF